jgi:folate-binding protein YgfZ
MSEVVSLRLHDWHQKLGARFGSLNGQEWVVGYGVAAAEYAALRETAGVLDLSFRSRVCLTGADRVRFLHGQVTNDVKRLQQGEGCYAALTTAKGKLQSDLNIFCLPDELLLDFEPGLTATVVSRLEKYLVADDVQVVDVAPHYGLLSVQGPQAEPVIRALNLFPQIPAAPLNSSSITLPELGEVYLMNHPRLGLAGFDVFVPNAALELMATKLATAVSAVGGAICGWEAFEMARIEAGIPRFGVDMDETHLASECGIEARAISYQKGCYLGQEVLNRIHSIGHVNRELRQLQIEANAKTVPAPGTKLFLGDKEVGHLTSAVWSPRLKAVAALGYVRREANAVGTKLNLPTLAADLVTVVG